MNDYEHAHISEQCTCSACGCPIPLDDLKYLDFQADEGGISVGTPHFPTFHWAAGTIRCPGCGTRLPYEISSD